jgi:hypothetical protein
MNTFNYKKSIQALNLFSKLEGGSINYMKAIKLVWLSDRYHIRNNGRTITGDAYFALKNGPVASCTKDIILNFKLSTEENDYKNAFVSIDTNKYLISSISNTELNVFSKNEVEILNTIYKNYSHMSEFEISEFSHEFPEWKAYEERIKKGGKRFKIDMTLFFENLIDDTKLFINSPEEISEMKEYQETFYPFHSLC